LKELFLATEENPTMTGLHEKAKNV